MNYLAHIYLAKDHPDALSGALLGDFIKGRIPDSLPVKMHQAVRLHRKIDTYTDAHPLFRRSRERLGSGLRRFSGILIDLFYDHCLAHHWHQWHSAPLEQFCQQAYLTLESAHHHHPTSLRQLLPTMRQQNWLASYAEFETLKRALRGIDRRISRPTPLASGYPLLAEHYDALTEDFCGFFPEAVQQYRQWEALDPETP